MSIFKMIYSYFYFLFVKMTYHLLKEDEKEQIYQNKKGKYVIVVKNAERRKLLYEVVKTLSKSTVTYMPFAKFKFTSYGITKKNTVKWFCIEAGASEEWEGLSNLQKLRVTQYFVEFMQAKGLIIDDAKFSRFDCDSISEFLSFFIKSNEEDKIERSKGCMIKYIHHVFSYGGSLEEFYQNLEENVLENGYNIPYNSQIAGMCYDYFKLGKSPDSILKVLEEALYWRQYVNYSLVAIPDRFDLKFKVTEKTDEYTIYDGNLKIYQNISSEYKNFLGDGTKSIARSETATLDKMEAVIVDLNNNIIGYKFESLDKSNMRAIIPKNQKDIFKYVVDMVEYLRKYNYATGRSTKSKEFEIEKCLVYIGYTRGKYTFRCNTLKDLFNLTVNDWENLKEQITVIFFNLLSNYMAKEYGELTSKEQFLEKNEIRFLSPIVAKEFVNFVLGKTVNYIAATDEFFKLLDNRTAGNKFCYDARFCYDPTTVHFAFDYEAEKKYNVKFEKGTTEKLPDGRTVVTFNKSRNISAYVEKEKSARESALSTIKTADEHVKLVGISEIILGTERLNTNNMYNVIGYVSEPLKGEQLTDEALLKLNNRDLLRVAGCLFAKFSTHYIPWENIWMDTDFKFCINYMSQDFQVKRSEEGVKNASTFVQSVFNYLLSVGYNPNAFVGWTLPNGGFKATRQYLIDFANKANEYCSEHNIYYNSNRGPCPACERTKYYLPYAFERIYARVFEDSVAVHYNIDPNYNLKVYKPEYRSNLEATVRMQASMRIVKDTKSYFYQDCFRPIKIALDTNNQFVGYVYEVTKFEAINGNISDVCVNFADGKNLNNLARLKSLIRLILQVKEITNQKFGFVTNPFTYVFLNPSHKRQVQILNVEFIAPCNQNGIMQTMQWTHEYIFKVLETDPTIEYRRSPLPEGLESILAKLTKLAGEMTKKCSIHNIYYKSSYICCPKCVDPANQPKNIMYTEKSRYDSKTPINEGGEAFIYSHTNGNVVKVFKEGQVNREFKSSVLFRISTKKDLLEKVNQEEHKYKYVIPKEILIDSKKNEVFGYIMDWVENAFPISDLKDKDKIQKMGLCKDDIFEIIITIGEGIEALHKLNIYIGDLNGRNILFDANKNVYFLDFDGMGVDEITPEFCTDGYIDPLSKKSRCITMKDDWYSFAVQAFYYLTYTHPFNGIYSVKIDGNTVRLDIPEKMERRISLLGNHGMKAPEIAEHWDWMDTELNNAFLNIFEGDCRESIVPFLKKQYQALSTGLNEKSFNKIYRINSKFIAAEIKAFCGEVVKVINPYAAICKKGSKMYFATLVKSDEQIKEICINFKGGVPKIDDVVVSDDGKIVFIVYNTNCLIITDWKQDKVLYNEQISYATNVVVNDRTVYFTGTANESSYIQKRTVDDNGEILKETIGFGNKSIKWFDVRFNTKFILITKATENMDELYCNSQKFCTFEYNSAQMARNANYNVVYDNDTKSWLVVNDYGNGIVIHIDGQKTEVDISKYVDDDNFKNIYFVKGNIYIPREESMYIINVVSKVAKKMECHKIMTPESRICNVNSSGFSVITQDVLYEICRG